ncbi:hypothetical protein GCM10009650_03670 [Nesterenkonia jeotgali]
MPPETPGTVSTVPIIAPRIRFPGSEVRRAGGGVWGVSRGAAGATSPCGPAGEAEDSAAMMDSWVMSFGKRTR